MPDTTTTKAWIGLADRAPSGKRPPVVPGRRFVAVPDIHEPPPDTLADLDGHDMEGVTLAIVYRDAKGTETMRRVTMHRVRVTERQAVYIACFCHERQATRSFRYDRIGGVIDMETGEIRPRDPFFADELGVCVPGTACARPDTGPSLFDQIKRTCRPDMILLAGLSRCDGRMLAEEVDAILKHAQHVSADDDLWPEAEDIERLRRHVRHLRPDRDSLDRAAHAVADLPMHRQRRLLHACREVMDADGIQHPAEIDFILELQELLAE